MERHRCYYRLIAVREAGFASRVHHGRGQTDLGLVGTSIEHDTVSTGSTAGYPVFYRTWWLGLEASIDGNQIPVSSLDGSALTVRVFAGLEDARMDVTSARIGSKPLSLTAAGRLLVLVAAAAALVRRWATTRPRSVDDAVPRLTAATPIRGTSIARPAAMRPLR